MNTTQRTTSARLVQIVITIPADEDHECSDYVGHVANLLAEGYMSGHTDRDHHWMIDTRRGE